MNYRHAFHAGNFADLVKHAALTTLIADMTRDKAALQILDTHAGAGLYDLAGPMSQRSGEAQAGVVRLMASGTPTGFAALKAQVRALNRGGLTAYPGSPLIAASALRRQDAYIGCELRPDDHGLLVRSLAAIRGPAVLALKTDGYAEASKPAPTGMRRLVLIDPPFEAAGEYRAIVTAVAAALGHDRRTVLAIWTPLKDLDTFDRFIGALEGIGPPSTLVAECRLRALRDPLAMNGCALVIVGAPAALDVDIEAACRWVVEDLGEPGGEARLWRTGG